MGALAPPDIILHHGKVLTVDGRFQIVEAMWQLQGKWDKFHAGPERWTRYGKKRPADFRSLQVPNARRACTVSHAGTGSHVTVAVLEKEKA